MESLRVEHALHPESARFVRFFVSIRGIYEGGGSRGASFLAPSHLPERVWSKPAGLP
jgi:hypothetical protein